MSKEYVLLKWDSNWSDEMDVSGFSTMLKTDWEKYEKFLESYDSTIEFYIGTNESIGYANGAELLEEIWVEEITVSEYNTIEKFFEGSWGFTEFLEVEEEEYGEDEDEDDDL